MLTLCQALLLCFDNKSVKKTKTSVLMVFIGKQDVERGEEGKYETLSIKSR